MFFVIFQGGPDPLSAPPPSGSAHGLIICFLPRYEFTIEVEEHERIWLQLVYINLSRTNMDQHNIDECIYSEEKIEIIDSKWSSFVDSIYHYMTFI